MKTVVGLFDTYPHAENAARDLQNAGIAREEISLVASNETEQYAKNPVETNGSGGMAGAAVADAGVGAGIGGTLGLLAGASLFVIPGLGWLAGVGWLAGMLGGAAVGGTIGGIVGVLTHIGISEEDAAYYNEGIRRGAVLVAVRADESESHNVASVLSRAGAMNIEERVAQWRQEGYMPNSMGNSTPNMGNSTLGMGNGIPGIQTGGRNNDGSPDTRGITEKAADAVTGNRVDDKTGAAV